MFLVLPLLAHLSGISEATIEPHEEAALFATVALVMTGALALAGLVTFRRPADPTERVAGGYGAGHARGRVESHSTH